MFLEKRTSSQQPPGYHNWRGSEYFITHETLATVSAFPSMQVSSRGPRALASTAKAICLASPSCQAMCRCKGQGWETKKGCLLRKSVLFFLSAWTPIPTTQMSSVFAENLA
uniref:Uncharacterized protein n=1 Tax=Mus spicilegus TaxID=10103 RepID=A0A8C6HUZ0_MUSSI